MHEYKVVPAPLRVARVKGLKTTPERFAHLLTEALNAVAAEGWEYVRTESLPCEERKGLTGTRTTTQAVMIFRRELPGAGQRPAIPAAPPVREVPGPEVEPARRAPAAHLAAVQDAPLRPVPDAPRAEPSRRTEPVFRPGALSRGPGERPFPPLRGVAPADERDDPDGRSGDR